MLRAPILPPIWTRFLIAPLSLSFHRASPRLGRCAKHNSKTGFPGLEAQHLHPGRPETATVPPLLAPTVGTRPGLVFPGDVLVEQCTVGGLHHHDERQGAGGERAERVALLMLL